MKNIALTVFALCLFVAPHMALAGEPRLMASHGDWDVYMFLEDGNKVCYMASQPKLKEGAYSKRGEPFALITKRPAENTKDVFSYITGYSYKAGSDVILTANNQDFTLFTQDETAWAADSATDRSIANAIKSGSKMVIKGVSSRGTKTTDTFSLSGSSKAYQRMNDECR